MNFKFKLSKRLALIWSAAFGFAAAAAIACTSADLAVGPAQPTLDITGSTGSILFQETFEDNQFASRGWYDNTSLATTATQHIAGSTRALEARFLAGTTTPTWGGAARRLFTPTPTLYVSYWVKYSANWVGSGRPYHPHEFLIMSDQDDDYSGLANGWLVSYIEHNYQNGGIPLLALQDNKAINTSYGPLPVDLSRITENRSTSGCNGVVELNVATSCFNMPPWYNGKTVAADQVWFRPSAGTPGYKGDWNHVEVYLRLNSVVGGIGLPDGVMQYWFNGTLVIDRKDILYRTGARPNIQFRQFAIAPYIGDGSPVDQTMWVDDLVLATGRLGTSTTAVASITLSPSSATVPVGGTQLLSAILKDSAGTTLSGRSITWTSSDPAVAAVNSSGMVSGIAVGTTIIRATSEGVHGTASITTASVTTASNPGTVSDLVVKSLTDTSATITFTEVTDGTGSPANYFVRFAPAPLSWGSAADVNQGTCKVPLAGTTIGASRSCTVLGLQAGTNYEFQLVAFRGTLNVDAVFGALSNKATGTAQAPPAASSVTISPASASLAPGSGLQMSAAVKDAAGDTLTGRSVTWTSSDTTVAWVSNSGWVTGRIVGSVTITAKSEDVQGTASVSVIATTPERVTDLIVSGVTDTFATLTFTQVDDGTGLPASYFVRYAEAPLSWTSAHDVKQGSCKVPLGGTTIGTKRSCKVMGLQPGTTYEFQLAAFRGSLNVDAVFGELSNVARRTTKVAVASVVVNPASSNIPMNTNQQFSATVKDAAGNTLTGRTITWTSSNTAVATVASGGLVTGLIVGSATITASSEGVSGRATVSVIATNPGSGTDPGGVTDLAVSAVTDTSVILSFTEVTDGTGLPASYLVRFAAGALSWSSATEVSTGTCRVPMAGSTVGVKRSCTVLGLKTGTSYEFQLVAFRGTLNVDAVFGGLSNIAQGKTASVTPVPAASVVVSPAIASVAVGSKQQFSVTFKDGNGNTLTGRSITWASSNAEVAPVSSSGLVTGSMAGSATITATSEGVSGTAAVSVTSTNPGSVMGLAVAGVSDTSVTLTFTEVNDGTGRPASYFVRFSAGTLSWSSATDVSNGSCRVPMTGTTIGAKRSCTVLGLAAATSYQFQLVAFRGTLNVDAVFGGLSNVASGITTGGATAPLPPPPPPPPPPSPPPSAGTFPNEPSGFTVIEETGWEAGTLGNWSRIFQSADKPVTIETVGDSPLGESKVLQIGFAAGHEGGGGTELRYNIPSTARPSELYVGFYIQVSADWQGHSSAINKMVYLSDGDANTFSATWYEMFGSGSNPLDLYVVNQSSTGFHENVNQIVFQRGRWHRVEIYQQQGGLIRVWVDGALAIDRLSGSTRTTPFDGVVLSGIWGGIGDSKDHWDYMRFDRVRISGR